KIAVPYSRVFNTGAAMVSQNKKSECHIAVSKDKIAVPYSRVSLLQQLFIKQAQKKDKEDLIIPYL
ncbi:MAG: hypothetical protein UIM53_02750, partial [Acutalibacteraceae bacterium]|nr:hypothetical protein [Acutalibacteraceae bacterium]